MKQLVYTSLLLIPLSGCLDEDSAHSQTNAEIAFEMDLEPLETSSLDLDIQQTSNAHAGDLIEAALKR